MEIREFLPNWALDVSCLLSLYYLCFVHVMLTSLWQVTDDAEEGEDGKEVKDKSKRPDMIRWLAGFENFAVACDMTGVWKYASAQAHLRSCLKVAGATAPVV